MTGEFQPIPAHVAPQMRRHAFEDATSLGDAAQCCQCASSILWQACFQLRTDSPHIHLGL